MDPYSREETSRDKTSKSKVESGRVGSSHSEAVVALYLSLLHSTTVVYKTPYMTPFYSSALYYGSTLLYSTLAPLDFILLHSIMSLLDAATLPYYIHMAILVST